jgi:hypothetical protein
MISWIESRIDTCRMRPILNNKIEIDDRFEVALRSNPAVDGLANFSPWFDAIKLWAFSSVTSSRVNQEYECRVISLSIVTESQQLATP